MHGWLAYVTYLYWSPFSSSLPEHLAYAVFQVMCQTLFSASEVLYTA